MDFIKSKLSGGSNSQRASSKLKALTSRISQPSTLSAHLSNDADKKSGRTSNKIEEVRKSSLKSRGSRTSSGNVKINYRMEKNKKDKLCKDKFTATYSAWDGKQTFFDKPGRETNFGLFRRAHVRAHKRIRDTYDPLSFYFCSIE